MRRIVFRMSGTLRIRMVRAVMRRVRVVMLCLRRRLVRSRRSLNLCPLIRIRAFIPGMRRLTLCGRRKILLFRVIPLVRLLRLGRRRRCYGKVRRNVSLLFGW